jgi:hypothetical protein
MLKDKFKVGDRVKVVSYLDETKMVVGKEGTVVDNSKRIFVYVVVDEPNSSNETTFLFDASEIELLDTSDSATLKPENQTNDKIFNSPEHLESLIKATANTYMQSTDPAHFVVAGMFEACLIRFDFLYSEIDRLNKKLKEKV